MLSDKHRNCTTFVRRATMSTLWFDFSTGEFGMHFNVALFGSTAIV